MIVYVENFKLGNGNLVVEGVDGKWKEVIYESIVLKVWYRKNLFVVF